MNFIPIRRISEINSKNKIKTQQSQLRQSTNHFSKSSNLLFKSSQHKRKSKVQFYQPQFNILLKKKETIIQRNKAKNKTIVNLKKGLKNTVNNWVSSTIYNKHLSIPRTKTDIQQQYQNLALKSKNKGKKYYKKEDLEQKMNRLRFPSHQMMGKLLIKNRIYPQRCLTGQNILKLQENCQYTRFKLHELYSSYLTLLSFSQNSFKKFLKGFEMFLNIHKITIRSQTIEEQWQNKGNQISFENYLSVFKKMEQLIYKQTITDYLEVILEVCSSQNISYEDIKNIYIRRYDDKFQAQEQTQYLFAKLGKQKHQKLTKKQIYDLCFSDQNFCTQIYRLYAKQIRPSQTKSRNSD